MRVNAISWYTPSRVPGESQNIPEPRRAAVTAAHTKTALASEKDALPGSASHLVSCKHLWTLPKEVSGAPALRIYGENGAVFLESWVRLWLCYLSILAGAEDEGIWGWVECQQTSPHIPFAMMILRAAMGPQLCKWALARHESPEQVLRAIKVLKQLNLLSPLLQFP